MAPALVGEEKASRGKIPSDVFWGSIEGTNSKDRLEYPSEKPYWLMERLIKTSSKPGDLVLDCFAGSGKFGLAAIRNERDFILIDNFAESYKVMKEKTFVDHVGILYITWKDK
jgi:site-specific DNA-methyltransferase (adenine-specific)